jgi:hypothetical protein
MIKKDQSNGNAIMHLTKRKSPAIHTAFNDSVLIVAQFFNVTEEDVRLGLTQRDSIISARFDEVLTVAMLKQAA